jgi:hypothetical protein
MRDVSKEYRFDLGRLDLEVLEMALTAELAQELMLSPDGLTIRYPIWLITKAYDLLPGHQKLRVTMVSDPSTTSRSLLHHLNHNEVVLLWLIEAMAKRYPAFACALDNRQLMIIGEDNARLLTLRLSWDPLHLAW